VLTCRFCEMYAKDEGVSGTTILNDAILSYDTIVPHFHSQVYFIFYFLKPSFILNSRSFLTHKMILQDEYDFLGPNAFHYGRLWSNWWLNQETKWEVVCMHGFGYYYLVTSVYSESDYMYFVFIILYYYV
jgi:hypothetical protein